MKKLFLIFAALCCTVMANAQLGTPPSNEIWYTTTDGNILTASKYKVGKTLCWSTISEHGKKNGHCYIMFDKPVTSIGNQDFEDEDDLTEMSLPNSVLSIGISAFYHCNCLKRIAFGSGLISIGTAEDTYGVFEECDELENIALPPSVTFVGRNAFYDCDALKSFSCENVEVIYPQAFYSCDSLKSVNLGAKLKEIQSTSQGLCFGVFEECDELEVINIPASVTTLGRRAFYDCDMLKFVAIGSGVTAIPKDAFYNCNELKSVVIDGNGVSIGVDAFNDCEKLESVSFLGATPPASFEEDCFDDCSPSLKYYVLEENYERYNGNSLLSGKVVAGPPYNEIWYTTNNGGTAGYTHSGHTPPPLNVYMDTYGVQFFDGNPPELSTSDNCFKNCWNLVSVVLPSSITYIGGSAFDSCPNLVSVSIPSTVTGIGDYAFFHCYSLQNIKLPAGLTYIGIESFLSCESLQSITIPSGVNSIPQQAFYGCKNLRSVTILGTIQSIGTAAFFCDNLFEIFYLGEGTPECASNPLGPATIYVKDATGRSDWAGRPVRSWRSGKGDGSSASPLEIENYPQLYGFSLEVEYMNGANLCAKLTKDITGNTNVLTEDGSLKTGSFKPWLPIGGQNGKDYSGEFNGGGHTISGLYFNDGSRQAVGLFGKTVNNAHIHDVGVKDSYFYGKTHVGGICGDLASGRMDNCWNAATVESRGGLVGGMAGSCYIHSTISNCHNVGKVLEGYLCGGVCGAVYSSQIADYSISNCISLDTKCSKAYTLADGCPESKIHNVSRKNASAFASGEVCWLLNGYKQSDKWRQQLGVDGYPTLSGEYYVYYSEGAKKYYSYDENISGSGTADDPYRIGNWFELLMFADIVNKTNTSACAILTADITMNTDVLDSSGNLNSGTFEPWTPIGGWGNGSGYNGYSGEFDGGGHTISGLYFNDESRSAVGLFGMTNNSGNVTAYIHDLGIKDSYFRGKSHVGGICGDFANGRIENCWNAATVQSAEGTTGGIVGSCWKYSTISGCYNVGKVAEGTACGGICGSVAKNVNGITSLSNCVSLYGKCDVAYNLYDDAEIDNVLIKDASDFASGEVCWILNGFQTSAKWRQHLGVDGYPTLSGNYLVYYNATSQSYCNYDWDISGPGTADDPYRIGNKFELLMFADIVNNGNTSACGILTADITMNTDVLDSNGNLNSGTFETWTPIGGWTNNGYKGEFNGNGYTISGLYFNDTDKIRVGLFGKTDDGANIHDLGVKDSYFRGSDGVAGICGDHAWGQIKNCWNGATVISTKDVSCAGGIAGSCWVHASVDGCYNIGKISNQSKCGGICGQVAENIAGVTYSVSNCVSLYGKCDNLYNLYKDDTYTEYAKIDNVFIKDTDAFTSGEVCWILNGNKYGRYWRQQLGTDAYPTLSGTYSVNYTDERQYYNNEPTREIWYTSTDGKIVTPYHSYSFGANITNNTYGGGWGVIIFDKAVTSIRESAFLGCSSLKSIEIPDNVTSIEGQAFRECSSLKSIEIPDNVTSIGNSAFYECSSLKSIEIPDNVTSIGKLAFYKCGSLQSINIPSGVKSIGEYAFSDCDSLATVTFNSLPVLGTEAFWPCSQLDNKILDLTDSDKPFIGTSLANYPEGGFTKANYHRTLEKDKWGTIVLPFAPTDGLDGLAFYELKEMTMASGGSLVFTIVEAPKAGVPYLIRNISDSKTDFTLTASNNPTVTVSTTGQTAGDFTLKGSFQQTSLNTTEVPNGNLYYLKDDQFYHANGKINIAPFRAYIEGNGSSQAKSFMLIVEDDGEVDAIPGILNGDGSIDETEAFYDINGRRLSAPVKGQVNVIRTKSGKTVKRMF